jgi:hypothetical protein
MIDATAFHADVCIDLIVAATEAFDADAEPA